MHKALHAHAADLLQVTSAGDAEHHGEENDRSNQHPHEADETVGNRLESDGEVRSDEPARCPQQSPRESRSRVAGRAPACMDPWKELLVAPHGGCVLRVAHGDGTMSEVAMTAVR